MTNKGAMTMVRVFLALILTLSLSAAVSAQTHLTSTTNSAAISATQTTFALASATGVAAGGALYIDRELMSVRSVSGINVTVVRGQSGTVANAHSASRTVIIIPSAAVPTVVSSTDPTPINGVGGCTYTAHRYLPIINVTNGNVWTCRWVSNVRVWAATNETLITYNSLILQ